MPMAKMPLRPLSPVLWSRSSSIGTYPALKLLLCSLLADLRSIAFSLIDFFTGAFEISCGYKGKGMIKCYNYCMLLNI